MNKPLKEFSDQELVAELKIREEHRKSAQHIQNMNPVGRWRVTTEDDCEGRTIKDLGIHEGHIVDIARELAADNYYTLQFSMAAPSEKPTPKPKIDSVHISLDIQSGTWDMSAEQRAKMVADMLAKKKAEYRWNALPSNFYAGVLLNFW